MGLAKRLGDFVSEATFSLLSRMRSSQLPLVKIGINITPSVLMYSNIVDDLRGLMDKFQVAGDFVEIEITEGSLVNDPTRARRVLSEIRRMGISVALDDFGTGYSSLAYLRQLPIDRLKIDQSFVRSLPRDVEACGVVIAIVQMAKALDMEVLAEGIENKDQENLLRCLGVDIGQGYLYSKPFPADRIASGQRNVPIEQVRSSIAEFPHLKIASL